MMKIISEPNYISFTVENPVRLIIEPWAEEYTLAELGSYSIKFENSYQDRPEFKISDDILVVYAPSESTYTLYSPTGLSIDENAIRFPAMPSGMTTKDFMDLVGLTDKTSEPNPLKE